MVIEADEKAPNSMLQEPESVSVLSIVINLGKYVLFKITLLNTICIITENKPFISKISFIVVFSVKKRLWKYFCGNSKNKKFANAKYAIALFTT